MVLTLPLIFKHELCTSCIRNPHTASPTSYHIESTSISNCPLLTTLFNGSCKKAHRNTRNFTTQFGVQVPKTSQSTIPTSLLPPASPSSSSASRSLSPVAKETLQIRASLPSPAPFTIAKTGDAAAEARTGSPLTAYNTGSCSGD